MPRISGWDIVKRIRSDENPQIRCMNVIAVTALAMAGDEDRIIRSGFDGYIVKPIDAPTFAQTIQTILDRVQSRVSYSPSEKTLFQEPLTDRTDLIASNEA